MLKEKVLKEIEDIIQKVYSKIGKPEDSISRKAMEIIIITTYNIIKQDITNHFRSIINEGQ